MPETTTTTTSTVPTTIPSGLYPDWYYEPKAVIPAGFPTFESTGPAPGTTFTKVGYLYITVDGTVLENIEASGLSIRANDVTVRNSLIVSTATNAIKLERGYTNLTMDRIEIIGNVTERDVAKTNNGVYGEGGWTLTNSRISGYPDGAKVHANTLVEGNYFWGNQRTGGPTGNLAHTDGIQTSGGQGGVTIRRNTFSSLNTKGGDPAVTNYDMGSNLMIQAQFGPVKNYLIEGNYFSGGNFTLYFNVQTDKTTGEPMWPPHENVVLRNNTFKKDSWQFGPLTSNTTGRISEGNVLDDGTPLNLN